MWNLDRVKSAARRSFWLALLIPIGVIISLAITMSAIFPGRGSGAVGGLMGGLGPYLYRFRRVLRLRKRERVLYYDVLRFGLACAEPRVNEAVHEQLAEAVTLRSGRGSSQRANHIVLAVIATVPVVAALVAAVLRSPWWLLEVLATPLLLLVWSSVPSDDPLVRLERLLATMGPAD